MEKILNQEEIDALFRAARGLQPRTAQAGRDVRPCNFRQAGQIARDQARSVSMLHESFARNLTHSLAAYLRVVFEVNLVSVEQLAYAEFLQRLPEVTYLASIALQPFDAEALVQLDLALAMPVIDLLLGGQGTTAGGAREITEIEEQIVESVVRLICHELESCWQPVLDVKMAFAERELPAGTARLMSPTEKTLALSFEIRMPDVRGVLNLVFPAVISNALLRKLSQQWSHRRPKNASNHRTRMWEKVRECSFPLELVLPESPLPASALVSLKAGDVVALRHAASQPAVLSIGGRKMFSAYPVSSGKRRAAQLQQRLQTATSHRKESE